jgi:hypothetical protein
VAQKVSQCVACNERMSAKAVVCPFCGARQPDRDPCTPAAVHNEKRGLQDVQLSREEVSALLATDRACDGDDVAYPGTWATLLLPHPLAGGARWLSEVVLILASLPLTAGVLILLLVGSGIGGRRTLRALPREANLVLMALAGGPLAYVGLTRVFGMSWQLAVGISAGGAVAAFLRLFFVPKRTDAVFETARPRR